MGDLFARALKLGGAFLWTFAGLVLATGLLVVFVAVRWGELPGDRRSR